MIIIISSNPIIFIRNNIEIYIQKQQLLYCTSHQVPDIELYSLHRIASIVGCVSFSDVIEEKDTVTV